MDFARQFWREVEAFADAVRKVDGDAPVVPSCPGWSVSDLVVHLGSVHRAVIGLIQNRVTELPGQPADTAYLGLPADHADWPPPEHAPNHAPLPASLVDWFRDGAATLHELFRDRDPHEAVWTWSREHTVGFWARMQTIEAAIHRWDAENATDAPEPVDSELAADAVGQTFEVMAPFRRSTMQAPPGEGERYRFRQTDGTGEWTVRFDGDAIETGTGPGDVELAGSASELMLFLWQRLPADRLDVTGDRALLERYFALVPPV